MDEQLESWIEGALWAVPGLLALRLFARGQRGARATWLLVAGACAAIVADKLVDLQTRAYLWMKSIAQGVDPVHRMKGAHLWMRVVGIGGAMALGALALVAWARLDRARTRGKALAVAGLLALVGFLGLRMFPAFKQWEQHPRDLMAEGAAWLLVVAGVRYGWMTNTRSSLVATRGADSPGSR